MNPPKIGYFITVGKVDKTVIVEQDQLDNNFIPKMQEFREIVHAHEDDRFKHIEVHIQDHEQWCIVYEKSVVSEGFHLGTISLALDDLIKTFKGFRE